MEKQDRSRDRSKKGSNGRDRTPARSRSKATRQQSASRTRGAPSVHKAPPKDVVLNHTLFVVGNSDLASHLAALSDAHLIAGIVDEGTLSNFQGIIGQVPGLIKVAFIDCWAPDHSTTPDQAISFMTRACKIVTDRCAQHTHDGAHCEPVLFLPFSRPSNCVANGLPENLNPSLDKTSWFNEINKKISALSIQVTNSSAMSLANAARNPTKKDRHCFIKWTEFDPNDDSSMKRCRTLNVADKAAMEAAVCRHFYKFSSFGRRIGD